MTDPSQQDSELEELLKQYSNLKHGTTFSFIEEESFEKIIDYFDEKDDLPSAMEAVNYGLQQYPYSSMLHIKKADLLITTRHYNDALELLEKAELLDRGDINL